MGMEVQNTTAQMMKTASGGIGSGAKQTSSEVSDKSYASAADYAKELAKRFDYFGRQTKIDGVPTTVSVSPAFLEKCRNDPEKQRYLESNLAAMKQGVEYCSRRTRLLPGNPVMTHASYSVDANGNITMSGGCTNDPDGKIVRENAEKRARKQKEEAARLVRLREKRQAERRANEKVKEKGRKVEYRATGRNVTQLTDSLLRQMGGLDAREDTASLFDALV